MIYENNVFIERVEKFNEVETELYNAEEEILDNYLETRDYALLEDMQKKYQDAYYKARHFSDNFLIFGVTIKSNLG